MFVVSDFTITNAVASNNVSDPLELPENTAADITITVTTSGSIVFPVTIDAQATAITADAIGWTSNIDTVTIPMAGTLEFTVTATANAVLQAKTIINQNYLVTVTDSDTPARTQTFNIALDNEDGYPSATLDVVDKYPNPSNAALS